MTRLWVPWPSGSGGRGGNSAAAGFVEQHDFFAAAAQLVFGVFLLGDVLDRAFVVDAVAIVAAHQAGVLTDEEAAAVLAHPGGLQAADLTFGFQAALEIRP